MRSANQRTRADLADGSYWVYQYDSLGQVVSGKRYWNDGRLMDGQNFDYKFDDIGNRDTTGGRASAVSDYTANQLNQYTTRTVANKLDVLGIANPTAGVEVWKDSDSHTTANRKGEYFHYSLTVSNDSYPLLNAKSLYGATQTAAIGRSYVPPATESYSYDKDGNLTADGRWTTYVWDGENRLIEMRRDTSTPAEARQKLTFEYDHLGRRIRKTYFTYSGGWVEQRDTTYLYDGWNMVAEVDANNSNATLRTYVWGTDLSGNRTWAGGVGGLLWVNNAQSGLTAGIQFAAYDGNGNVAGLFAAADGSSTARYEYGPFGEPLRLTGTLAKANPVRWSTKVTDDEGGLVYYGYRYYNPSTGRWLSRDPIGELGGANLNGFVRNAPANAVDSDGRLAFALPLIPTLVAGGGAAAVGGYTWWQWPDDPNKRPEIDPGQPQALQKCSVTLLVGHNGQIQGYLGRHKPSNKCAAVGAIGCAISGQNADNIGQWLSDQGVPVIPNVPILPTSVAPIDPPGGVGVMVEELQSGLQRQSAAAGGIDGRSWGKPSSLSDEQWDGMDPSQQYRASLGGFYLEAMKHAREICKKNCCSKVSVIIKFFDQNVITPQRFMADANLPLPDTRSERELHYYVPCN